MGLSCLSKASPSFKWNISGIGGVHVEDVDAAIVQVSGVICMFPGCRAIGGGSWLARLFGYLLAASSG